MVWPEVSAVISDTNRCQLILSGPGIEKKIEDDGFDNTIFQIVKLNYLEISKVKLKYLSEDIGKLVNLTTLTLHGNELGDVPLGVGCLVALKFLDLSQNRIRAIGDVFSKLGQLQTLNVSANLLERLPSIIGLKWLSTLDISHNKFNELPQSLISIDGVPLEHLANIVARGNSIKSVPAALARTAPSLKMLDLENNEVKTFAGEVGDCIKLKSLMLKGNPLEDRRLRKVVDHQSSSITKPVIDFVRNNCARGETVENSNGKVDGKTKNKQQKKKKNKMKEQDANDDKTHSRFVRVLHWDEDGPVVCVLEEVQGIRPYIACCILRNVDLKNEVDFKNFISLQTKLHENICKKRTMATIATHDLSKINGKKLFYDARLPNTIKITPLQRQCQMTAMELFTQLQREAEAVRKEKKRNTYSGIHKYLYLLEGKKIFPYLRDENGLVISIPPITNSNDTKISADTTDVFVEVTSSNNLNACKEVLKEMLHQIANMFDKQPEGVDDGDTPRCCLTVQQCRVVDSQQYLRVLYPGPADLNFDDFNVVREQKKK